MRKLPKIDRNGHPIGQSHRGTDANPFRNQHPDSRTVKEWVTTLRARGHKVYLLSGDR